MIENKVKYNSDDDARMRLDGTIIRYKDEPVMYHHQGDMIGDIRSLIDNSIRKEINPNDVDLDVSSPPIGFVTPDGRGDYLTYISRNPRRRYKQGLHPSHCSYYVSNFKGDGSQGLHAIDATRDFPCSFKELGKTIKGIFPSFDEAFKTKETALSRKIGIVQRRSIKDLWYVYNSTSIVGMYDGDLLLLPHYRKDPVILNQLERVGFKIR